MRVGFVRSDIQRFYLNDVENTSQRCFSSEPKGQSRYFRQATAADLLVPLNAYALLSVRGSIDTAAGVDTTLGANVLKIRVLGTSAFTTILVTEGNPVANTTIRDDLNAAFIVNSLPFIASVVVIGVNEYLQIDTVAPNSGPMARIELDTFLNGSTLNPVVGFVDGAIETGETAA